SSSRTTLCGSKWNVSPRMPASPPTRISFVAALRLICDEWLWSAVAVPGAIPKAPAKSSSLSRDLDPAAPPLRAQLPQGGEDQVEQLRSQTPEQPSVVKGIEMPRVPPYPTGIGPNPDDSPRRQANPPSGWRHHPRPATSRGGTIVGRDHRGRRGPRGR